MLLTTYTAPTLCAAASAQHAEDIDDEGELRSADTLNLLRCNSVHDLGTF
jgi:hypothetical protein